MKKQIATMCVMLAMAAGAVMGQTDGQWILQKKVTTPSPGFRGIYVTPSNSATLSVDESGNAVFKPWSELGGAPIDAPYIVSMDDPTLTNEVVLGSLASGLMRVNTTTGAITSITNSAGIASNISDETGTGVIVFGTAPVFTTRITLPNAAAPTTSTVGQMAVDNNALGTNRGAVQMYDGTANTLLVGTSSAPSTTGQVPVYQGSGVVAWGARGGIYGPITFSAPGSQTLTNTETYLDPAGIFSDGITGGSSLGGSGLGYVSHINVGLKFNAVTTATPTTVTITVKNGASSIVGFTTYNLGSLTSYTGPEVRIPLMVYLASAVTSELKVYISLSDALSSGTVDAVNLEAVSYNVTQ